MTKLIVFDFDNTLFDFYDVNKKGFSKAFKEVYKINADLDEVNWPGMTLKSIIVSILKKYKVSEEVINKNLTKAKKIIEKNLIDNVNKGKLLPGAMNLVLELKKKAYIIGIISGSSEKMIAAALKKEEMSSLFDFIVSGGSEESRNNVADKLIKEAQKYSPFKEIIVIGDSVRDAEFAKMLLKISAGESSASKNRIGIAGSIFVKSIGVTTGRHNEEELRSAGCDYVFNNLSQVHEILKLIS